MKKINKSTFACILAALCVLGGCTSSSSGSYTVLSGQYWLGEAYSNSVGQVDETCEYAITFSSEEDGVQAELSYGVLTTRLKTDGDYYMFTTESKIQGKFIYEGEEHAIDDYTRSQCVFYGPDNKLFPVSSSKEILSTTPMQYDGKFDFYRMAYTVHSLYDLQTASATVTVSNTELPADDEYKLNNKYYNFENSLTTYENLTSQNFFDNELLMFFPRACKFEEGFSVYFSTIDANAKKIQQMTLSVDSSAPTKEISLTDYKYNGISSNKKNFQCFNVSMSIRSQFSGSAIKLCYSGNEQNNENRHRLVEMKTDLPYSAGTYTYTLKSVNTNLRNA